MNASHIAQALGGSVIGRNKIAVPTPGHSRADRGTTITFDPAAPGGILVHSFNGGDPLAIKDIIRAALGLGGFIPGAPAARIEPQHAQPAVDDGERTRYALELWRATVPASNTLVERYLAGRELHLPGDVSDIRFLASCPFGKERHPAMVSLMRDIFTDEPMAVHRTALKPDGSGKAIMADGGQAKRMLGPVAGAAVKLIPDEAVSIGLGLSEGIENGLTAICGGWRPVWAAGSSGAIERFPVLSSIDALTIFSDAKPVEVAAARKCASRWQEAGREVTILRPPGDRDWNDERRAS